MNKLNLVELDYGFRLEPIFAASKMRLALKVVKSDSKIINSLCYSKFVSHSVCKSLKDLSVTFHAPQHPRNETMMITELTTMKVIETLFEGKNQ